MKKFRIDAFDLPGKKVVDTLYDPQRIRSDGICVRGSEVVCRKPFENLVFNERNNAISSRMLAKLSSLTMLASTAITNVFSRNCGTYWRIPRRSVSFKSTPYPSPAVRFETEDSSTLHWSLSIIDFRTFAFCVVKPRAWRLKISSAEGKQRNGGASSRPMPNQTGILGFPDCVSHRGSVDQHEFFCFNLPWSFCRLCRLAVDDSRLPWSSSLERSGVIRI